MKKNTTFIKKYGGGDDMCLKKYLPSKVFTFLINVVFFFITGVS